MMRPHLSKQSYETDDHAYTEMKMASFLKRVMLLNYETSIIINESTKIMSSDDSEAIKSNKKTVLKMICMS
jgi:hypothetical protein